jgi:hypothetical protein
MAGPRTKTVDGVKLVSMAALAELVGKSKRTIQRAEADGKLPRPEHTISKPGLLGHGSERFYSPSEVAAAVALFAKEDQLAQEESGTRLFGPQPSTARPWQSDRHAGSQPRRWSRIDSREQEEAVAEVEKMGEERCPSCKRTGTIVWQPRQTGITLKETAFCTHCDQAVVPIAEFSPPAQPNTWGSGGFPVPLSATPPTPRRQRPEPLTVRGAVRAPKPARPRIDIPLPPLS